MNVRSIQDLYRTGRFHTRRNSCRKACPLRAHKGRAAIGVDIDRARAACVIGNIVHEVQRHSPGCAGGYIRGNRAASVAVGKANSMRKGIVFAIHVDAESSTKVADILRCFGPSHQRGLRGPSNDVQGKSLGAVGIVHVVNATADSRREASCAICIVREGACAACHKVTAHQLHILPVTRVVDLCSVDGHLNLLGDKPLLRSACSSQFPRDGCGVVGNTLRCFLPGENEINRAIIGRVAGCIKISARCHQITPLPFSKIGCRSYEAERQSCQTVLSLQHR